MKIFFTFLFILTLVFNVTLLVKAYSVEDLKDLTPLQRDPNLPKDLKVDSGSLIQLDQYFTKNKQMEKSDSFVIEFYCKKSKTQRTTPFNCTMTNVLITPPTETINP